MTSKDQEVRAIRATLYWLESHHDVLGQPGLAKKLASLAIEKQLPRTNIGISQSSISKYLNGKKEMLPQFCNLMSTLVTNRRQGNFSFPEECDLIINELKQEDPYIMEKLQRKYNNGKSESYHNSANHDETKCKYIDGKWIFYSYSKRKNQTQRMIRK